MLYWAVCEETNGQAGGEKWEGSGEVRDEPALSAAASSNKQPRSESDLSLIRGTQVAPSRALRAHAHVCVRATSRMGARQTLFACSPSHLVPCVNALSVQEHHVLLRAVCIVPQLRL